MSATKATGASGQHTPGPWMVNTLVGMSSGRPMGFDVSRLKSPGVLEYLERGRIFQSEAAANAAIADTTQQDQG